MPGDTGSGMQIVHLLRAVAVELNLLGADFAAANDLHVTDLRAIIELLDAERDQVTATPTWLGDRLGLNSASVTALIDRLERMGHVRRERDAIDRRRVLITVTPSAQRLGLAFFGPLFSRIIQVTSALDAGQVQTIRQFLAQLAGEVSAHRRAGTAVAASGMVVAVSSNSAYSFTKPNRSSITLLAGLGVEGDVHAGVTVRHRSRVARDPTQPNLRQVHLMHAELFAEVGQAGFTVSPGDLGENITTSGIHLLGLPVDTLLRIGDQAVVQVTGLRNPCLQIDSFRDGLLRQVAGRDEAGAVVRRAGIMGIVLAGGQVRPGDAIIAELPDEPYRPLDRV